MAFYSGCQYMTSVKIIKVIRIMGVVKMSGSFKGSSTMLHS